MLFRSIAFIALVVFSFSSVTSALSDPSNPDYVAARKVAYGSLLKSVGSDVAFELLNATVGETKADDIPQSTLAHMLFMRRHFAKAAFLYDTDIQLTPDHIESYSNLAALLVELNASDPVAFPQSSLDWALTSARHAASRMPQDALVQNTLARAALARHLADGADELRDEALRAAELAVKLDPAEPLLWSNLARIHKLLGNTTEAEAALDQAREAGPNDPGYWVAATEFGRTPAPSATSSETVAPTAEQCSINFKCQTQCVSGLSTGALIVSCEIEQANQIALCMAAKPYARAYDCKAGKLLSGDTSPDPDFKFCAPNICITITPDGKGGFKVQTQLKKSFGPLDASLKVEGGYSPSNGYSFVKFTPDARFNVLHKAPGTSQLKKWGVSTSFVSGRNGAPAKLDIGGQSYSPALLGI